MHVKVISFHVFDTPIDMLERLFIGADQGCALAAQLIDADNTNEIVPICTCNRLEFYLSTTSPEWLTRKLYEALSALTGIAVDDLIQQAREYEGEEAIQHLFESIAGLKSIAVGENEIQGQIRQAYLAAREQGLARQMLSPLFETAIRVGKRIRNETRLGSGRFSLSKMALKQILPELKSMDQPRVLIIGTGKMARAAADYLQTQHHCEFVFISRHPEQRSDLARQFGRPIYHFHELPQQLARADVLFPPMAPATFSSPGGSSRKSWPVASGRSLSLILPCRAISIPASVSSMACASLTSRRCIILNGAESWPPTRKCRRRNGSSRRSGCSSASIKSSASCPKRFSGCTPISVKSPATS
ncbi:MAG: hypothetical protein Q9P14_13320 [candidate division KSB1 bacterium]|nr:hypothetical protein [candidate division KSB1 bacterium]